MTSTCTKSRKKKTRLAISPTKKCWKEGQPAKDLAPQADTNNCAMHQRQNAQKCKATTQQSRYSTLQTCLRMFGGWLCYVHFPFATLFQVCFLLNFNQVAENAGGSSVFEHQKAKDFLPRSDVPRMRPKLLDLLDGSTLSKEPKSLTMSSGWSAPKGLSKSFKCLVAGGRTNHRGIYHIKPGHEVNQTCRVDKTDNLWQKQRLITTTTSSFVPSSSVPAFWT